MVPRYGHGQAVTTAVTTTVCDDRAGTDASILRAAALVKELLPDANIPPPRIVSGELVYRLAAEDLSSRTGSPYVTLRLFHGAPPQDFGNHQADLLKALSASPEWRAYTAFGDERTGHGVIMTAVDDEASYDAAQARQRWVQSAWPDLNGRTSRDLQHHRLLPFRRRHPKLRPPDISGTSETCSYISPAKSLNDGPTHE